MCLNYNSCLVQIGFIGLVEEEWLVTLATVDREEVTYFDFVTVGTKLAKELREEVSIFFKNSCDQRDFLAFEILRM